MEDLMLTTFDNSFNPFNDFVSWWKEDHRLGHNTCELLSEKSSTSDVFSDEVNDKEILRAMNEIVKGQPDVYRIVNKKDFDDIRQI